MKIIEGDPPNCRGFALWKLGLLPQLNFVEEGSLDMFPLEETNENPQLIGVLMTTRAGPELIHLAVIDTNQPDYVWQIKNTGLSPEYVPIADVIDRYSGDLLPSCKIVMLKVSNSYLGS